MLHSLIHTHHMYIVWVCMYVYISHVHKLCVCASLALSVYVSLCMCVCLYVTVSVCLSLYKCLGRQVPRTKKCSSRLFRRSSTPPAAEPHTHTPQNICFFFLFFFLFNFFCHFSHFFQKASERALLQSSSACLHTVAPSAATCTSPPQRAHAYCATRTGSSSASRNKKKKAQNHKSMQYSSQ